MQKNIKEVFEQNGFEFETGFLGAVITYKTRETKYKFVLRIEDADSQTIVNRISSYSQRFNEDLFVRSQIEHGCDANIQAMLNDAKEIKNALIKVASELKDFRLKLDLSNLSNLKKIAGEYELDRTTNGEYYLTNKLLDLFNNSGIKPGRYVMFTNAIITPQRKYDFEYSCTLELIQNGRKFLCPVYENRSDDESPERLLLNNIYEKTEPYPCGEWNMENDLPIEDGRYWCKFYDDSYDVLEFSVENGWKYPEGVDSPVKKWMILAK